MKMSSWVLFVSVVLLKVCFCQAFSEDVLQVLCLRVEESGNKVNKSRTGRHLISDVDTLTLPHSTWHMTKRHKTGISV